jgi:hypothetical protein
MNSMLGCDLARVAEILDDLQRASGRLKLHPGQLVARVDPGGERLGIGDDEPRQDVGLATRVPTRVLQELRPVLARDSTQGLQILVEVGAIGEQRAHDIGVLQRLTVERKAGAVPAAMALRGHHRRQVYAD